MKLRHLAVSLLMIAALHVSAFAVEGATDGSTLAGNVSGFLKKDKSPYVVKETLVLPEGKALVIEAGVTLRFAEGTGLDVRGGSLAIMGENSNPVVFESLEPGQFWNGVSVTGLKRSEIQGLNLKNADYGFAVESGALELRDALIENAKYAAVYVRNGAVDLQWTKIQGNSQAGIWAMQSGVVNIDGSKLDNNGIALVAGEGAAVNIQRSHLTNNELAVLDFGENRLNQRNSLIEGNGVGCATSDLPVESLRRALNKNKEDLSQNVSEFQERLGEEPRNPYADGMKIYASQNEIQKDSIWQVSGNVGMGIGYHQVLMRHHRSAEPYVSGNDTVKKGDRYINYFQVPGLFTNWNANVLVESPYGRTVEVIADVSNDGWDHFKVHQFSATYTDQMQSLTLGDFNKSEGELYLSSLNAFGGLYNVKALKNGANEPLFEGSLFLGEVKAPKIVGQRNYDVYKDYIDDGEAEAQEMVTGGHVRWNMHRRFNGTLGYVGSKSFLEDPVLRDGMSKNVNTASPLVTSRAMYADGNWLFFPGDIKLKGQVAVGGADTANAPKIRAINQVFSEAGLDASNFSLLNKLMNHPEQVSSLSNAQLESLFGENAMKTPSEMRRELKVLLERAAKVAKETKVEDPKPSHGDFWGHEHWAFAGAYEWSNANTFVEGYLRYVGRSYYSAGSSDLLQNTRKVGGNLRQKIFDFWNLGFGYEMNVENAADSSDGYNIFGMAEGSQWGMFSGADDEWLKEHEQDQNRTLYIHDFYLNNDFKITEKVGLSFKFALNYRTRSTAQRLYANYSAASGIYNDPWFNVREGQSSMKLFDGKDSLQIDSARWRAYYDLADEDYLATQFVEKYLKHTFELGLTFKLPQKNVLSVSGVLVTRSDFSEFEQDDLIKSFDFKDETYGILGYYFNGGNFVEQRYPISLTTSLGGFRNTFSVMPRYKIYNRNDMREFEWNVMDNMNIDLSKDFLELALSGSVRQNFLSYEIEGEKLDEMELDVEGAASLRVHHTGALYSDWTVGSVFNYRPDSRADEYKDLYVMAALNYNF